METIHTDIILPILAFLITCAGAYTDLKAHKIPNRLTMLSMGAGLLVNFILMGAGGLAGAAAGVLTGFSFFLLFALGALKAGDVKLYMAVGAIGRWRFCLEVMVYSILIGGVCSLCLMIVRRNGRDSLRNLWNYGVNTMLTRKFHMYEPSSQSSYFSFGCCIAAGTAAAVIKSKIL